MFDLGVCIHVFFFFFWLLLVLILYALFSFELCCNSIFGINKACYVHMLYFLY